MTEEKHENPLFRALVEAQKSIQSVHKGSWNDFSKYRYASSEALMEEGRKALHEHDLALVMAGWTLSPAEPGLMVTATFRLIHGPSEEWQEYTAQFPAFEAKGRPLDKAVAGALTYLEGYFIRGLLCLPRVDEKDEVDQRDDRDHAPKPGTAKQQQKGSPTWESFEQFAEQYTNAKEDRLAAILANTTNTLARYRKEETSALPTHYSGLDREQLLRQIWDVGQELTKTRAAEAFNQGTATS